MQFEIIDIDKKGGGVSHEGIIFRFAYPGDTIEGYIVSKRKKLGRIEKVVKESPLRHKAPCKYAGECGGCAWQQMRYDEQLKIKEAKIKGLFGFCEPIIPAPQEFFYRNRMDFAFGPDFLIGLKDDKNKTLDIEKCWLLSEESNEIVNRLRKFVKSRDLKSYPEGIMRHVVIREGKNIKNTVINILTSDKGEFPLEELWEELKDIIQGITWSHNLSPADRSYGEIQKSIGQDYLLESLNGIKFKIPVQSFFQTNTRQAEKLIQIIIEFANLKGDEKVFDLYSGTGSIGLSLADKAKEVAGIEENEAAAKLSLENAKLNDIENFSAIAGRIEDIIKSLDLKSDKIILDPPRPGIHKKVLQKIVEAKPKEIVYVSCNPYTQREDINLLSEGGYHIEKTQPIDMFPHTPHIENVVLLRNSAP
ncbi:23S rRNA (uracil-5-)-methyltransferase RumA [candidate division WOR-1 bacterium RIFOXYA2_FULL_36_21]|uniref:23S rRNA (Uracil-5-)-methyltransferase RumA n=1 Tax=candidate division WOR-1 bacterium RIFOXYB2_FULL_36_35 TaxID=1802578 RepID=A0A1F4S2I5_UNCSA|nr:MAG: 23S rRNA (uracil-5-)-methyltransferase RumA [candidate division WOR-1 bacterium RIFOXYA2_FULL_36_21]OGC14654.1 MAG: 23S rRNA (uracil-5-)-methyltransferase RumA [candidate division WOR-1 bacterium RIFOXYB2_FULL_36_35]OGC19672.1 MAG: 23S rRNA (uracil-5-)-methyltransferase RumA [candidate division WOR-1 bacterium RIFOXYA12_FULL_36_13]